MSENKIEKIKETYLPILKELSNKRMKEKIEEEIEETFGDTFRDDNGKFCLDNYDFNKYGNKIIEWLIDRLAETCVDIVLETP